MRQTALFRAADGTFVSPTLWLGLRMTPRAAMGCASNENANAVRSRGVVTTTRRAVRAAVVGMVIVTAWLTCAPRASAWTRPTCDSASNTTVTTRGESCVGGHLLSSRGYVNSACLLSDVSPGQIYESTQVCGGGGAEYIAQARAITELNGPVTGGIDPSVQWEVGLNLGASAGRADLVHDDGGTLEVYELKQWTNSTYANTQQQAEAYVSALNTVDPEPRAPAQLGSGLSDSGWVDSFLTPVPGFPTCFVAGSDQPQYQYRLHVSWVTTPGVITVWYRDLPCFDPSTQPVPVPEPSASEPLIQAPVPGGDPTPVPLEQVPAGIWGPAPGNGIPAPDPAGGVLGGGGSGETLA